MAERPLRGREPTDAGRKRISVMGTIRALGPDCKVPKAEVHRASASVREQSIDFSVRPIAAVDTGH